MLILPTNTIKTAGTMRAISKATKMSITMINTMTKGRRLQGSNPIMVRAAMGSCSFYVVSYLCLRSAEPSQSAVVMIQKKTRKPSATSP